MLWIDTKTDEDARSLHVAMWGVVVAEHADGSVAGGTSGPAPEGGRFWADAIADLKSDPVARLEMARRHLPLPAAWREAAIALRAMIRSARKDGTAHEAELRELHRLAAISSFAGYGVVERIPYGRLAALDLGYHRIGADALPLLAKTDAKWMREAWGDPTSHTTAAVLYADLLASESARVRAEDDAAQKERMDRLFGDLEPSRSEAADGPETGGKSGLGRLIGRLLGR